MVDPGRVHEECQERWRRSYFMYSLLLDIGFEPKLDAMYDRHDAGPVHRLLLDQLELDTNLPSKPLNTETRAQDNTGDTLALCSGLIFSI